MLKPALLLFLIATAWLGFCQIKEVSNLFNQVRPVVAVMQSVKREIGRFLNFRTEISVENI